MAESGYCFHGVLSPDELTRAERLLTLDKRNQFITARGSLRLILGKYLQVSPDQIQFQYNQYGKPALAGQQQAISFNLSHSGEWGVLVVAREVAVGVDVERIDPDLQCLQLAQNYYNEHEQFLLNQYSPLRKRRGFFRLWTQKEAMLKLLGTGFRTDPQNNDGSIEFMTFPLAAAYMCSVAFKGEIAQIRRIHLSDTDLFYDQF
ncbi:4'-phosphopantetheinyl transferase family protein [Desulfuromusa kysingii]|nr:4'-phosphopantetheinyl transferase superfamily protein [Desulfuromusa kysingii]